MTLLQAKKDFLYKIIDISGDKLLHRRLLDMGFTPDTKIFIAGIAPFGGTILVGIRGILIALREDAARLINVSVCGKDGQDKPDFAATEGAQV